MKHNYWPRFHCFGQRKLQFAIKAAIVLVFASPSAVISAPLTQVRAVTAAQQDYPNRVTLTGEVRAQHSINLSFRTGGQIAEILVNTGDHVERGTALARLDSQLQEADLIAAQALADAATSQLLLAQTEFDRNTELLDNGFITRVVFEQSEVALIMAQGSLELAQAQLEMAKFELDYTVLKAPVTGTVTASFSEEGQISPVAQPVFTFAGNGARDAVFDVYESAFFKSTGDFPIILTFAGLPSIEAECILREVSPIVNPNTGTVQVRCGIVNPPPNLTLASVVQGAAMLRPTPLIVLPWEAMASIDGAPAVWIYDKTSRTVKIRRIEIERYEVGLILVRGGISDGEIVITQGARFLREGHEVIILEGQAE